MDKYLINKNELLSFLRYEILYKWKEARKMQPDKNNTFAEYLINSSIYQPDHEFIQSLCITEEERKDPIETGVYNEILPADLARYQAETFYSSRKAKCNEL